MNDMLRLGLTRENVDFEGFLKLKVFIPIGEINPKSISLKEIISLFKGKEVFNEFYFTDDNDK